ncbi:MAG: TolC family protein [Bacteroidia bacterium]|nr:TolC family protein [Bacteroidia bacterium]
MAGTLFIITLVWGCIPSKPAVKTDNKTLPATFYQPDDTLNMATISWRKYFSDEQLASLIDTALQNNQELNIILQEIEISKNEIRARKGEYLPFVTGGAGAGLEKPGTFTRDGAVEKQLPVKPGKEFPDPLTDYSVGVHASWEIDVWKKLRNAKKAAVMRYLASVEGKNFMVTHLVSEIADAYYELMALDNLLAIIGKNIELQSNALRVVRQQKDAAKVTQLAVNRFEAQLLNTQNLQYALKQKIVETENRIYFLTGMFPKQATRNSDKFLDIKLDSIQSGVPSQLLVYRPDIKQAELELEAAKLDVKSARANFYPSFGMRAGLGFQAFNPSLLVNPESVLYNLSGEVMAPLINRNAITAIYRSANAKQVQAVYNYEKTILNAYLDVLNQLSKIDNFSKSLNTKQREVEILNQSVGIANNLFNSAKADYAEVLLTQREALDAKIDMVEIKLKQLSSKVNIYRALGGGWK